MLKERTKEVVGEVRTIMSNRFPSDANIGIRAIKTMFGQPYIEVYVNPYRVYNSLMYRKHMQGAINSTIKTLLKTLMDKIFFLRTSKDYNTFLGVEQDDQSKALGKIDISKQIKTKIKLLRKDLQFAKEEKASHLYGHLDELMMRMETIMDEIIAIKAVEEKGVFKK